MSTETNWQKDYPLLEEVSEETLEENSSWKKMLQSIPDDANVVDFGCATGYFARLLERKNCRVTGVDVNAEAVKMAEQYCDRAIVADLDFVSISEILPSELFDVVVFGDVLEHLRNPWNVLADAKQLLNPDGFIVASIPNIAHGAIRLALLQGKFRYEQFGILDNTHLRFFTRQTVQELFEGAGYFIDAIDRTIHPIFCDSPAIPLLNKDDFEPELIRQIEEAPESETLQFIIRAFPMESTAQNVALRRRYSQTYIQLEATQKDLAETGKQLESLQNCLETSQLQLQQTQGELHHTKLQWQESQTQLQRLEEELQHTQSQLLLSLGERQQIQSQLDRDRVALDTTKNAIAAMETSKFWKLRTVWFKAKKIMGIKGD